jgi:hypothetical protein
MLMPTALDRWLVNPRDRKSELLDHLWITVRDTKVLLQIPLCRVVEEHGVRAYRRLN